MIPDSTARTTMTLRIFRRLPFASAGVFLLAGYVDSTPVVGISKDDGPALYARYCAACHGKTLGGGFGPALVGERFRRKWADAPAEALDSYIRKTMPPMAPGRLSEPQYSAIEAVITAANSLPSIALVAPRPEKEISKPAEVSPPDDAGMHAGLEPDHYAQSVILRRMNLVRNTGPVTDSLLRNPPDGDWLTWRRTLDAQGYSPLKQIDRSNVSRLSLVWSRSLTPGTNGIMPLVHDGVMYLNASGRVLALDAATGDTLWEFVGRTVEPTLVPLSQPRTIALYKDRVYVP